MGVWLHLSDPELISLARAAISAEVRHLAPPSPLTHSLPQGVFVTVEINGQVRGCRGELSAMGGSLEEEIVREARAAADHDPRYRPLQESDLRSFLVTVTIVDRTAPMGPLSSLQPEEGLVLRQGDRVGVVLPYEGRKPETRLTWAYRKAHASEGAPVQLSRLLGRRFRG